MVRIPGRCRLPTLATPRFLLGLLLAVAINSITAAPCDISNSNRSGFNRRRLQGRRDLLQTAAVPRPAKPALATVVPNSAPTNGALPNTVADLGLTAITPATSAVTAAPSGMSIPPECLEYGLAMQEACSRELEIASQAFGQNPAAANLTKIKVDAVRLRAYLANAPTPSVVCCTAAVNWNNAYCSCSPAVLDLAKSFINNDINQYREVARYLSNKCKRVGKPFTIYMDATCPRAKPGG